MAEVGAPPADPTIICPFCPTDHPTLLHIKVDAVDTRCTKCATRLLLVTRPVAGWRAQRLAQDRSRYQVPTIELGGRTRPRVFEAQPNIKVDAGSWITLVYRGPRLLGMADQTRNFWYPIPRLPSRHPHTARLLAATSVVCFLLALLQLVRWVPALLEFVRQHGTGASAVLVGVLLLLAAPFLLFAFQHVSEGWTRDEMDVLDVFDSFESVDYDS